MAHDSLFSSGQDMTQEPPYYSVWRARDRDVYDKFIWHVQGAKFRNALEWMTGGYFGSPRLELA